MSGRKIYIFTRPDGTYLVEKPECSRRVFHETERVNRSCTFSRARSRKTQTAAEVAWNEFQRQKREKIESQEENQLDLMDTTEQTINEIDALLRSIEDKS